jgi:uncharacterized protein YuzE
MIGLKWDTEADALYIALTTAEWDHTDEDGTYVYVGAHNDPVGIEVHHPERPWPLEQVLARYNTSKRTAQELRAYFPPPALLPPDSPPARQGPGHPPGCLTHVLCTSWVDPENSEIPLPSAMCRLIIEWTAQL